MHSGSGSTRAADKGRDGQQRSVHQGLPVAGQKEEIPDKGASEEPESDIQ